MIGKKLKHLFQLKEVQTIHNLVETDLFSFEPKINAQYTFIHVSSLTEQKNISGILAAFTQLAIKNKNWKLNLVGPANEALRQKIAESGLQQNVRISGELAYEEVAEQMKAADAFVLFSRHENFPCVVVEALCCGLPVVASDVAGIGEAVNKSNGLLVPEGDSNALCTALEHMLGQHFRYDRRKIADEASEKYSVKTIGSQIFNLYKRHFGAVQ
ncbi:glycosyltransferase [Pseudocnuella soli]|uniref:glycosyltransferase n=1 Tax=Pseudocnuella soli TaxID=2502779 RepID=UPI00104BA90E|nr:glycosyltransferase [Pseudocnuella soli]